MIGPSQPILVRVGEDIQLTCYLSPETNAQSMEVRWIQSHRYPAVYVYADGEHVTEEQMSEYRGRTVLVNDASEEGRLTLQIHNATVSDDGQYRCLFEKDGVYQEASFDLKVVGKDSRYFGFNLSSYCFNMLVLGNFPWHLKFLECPFACQIYMHRNCSTYLKFST